MPDNITLSKNPIVSRGQDVIRAEAEALTQLADLLDDNFSKACDLICKVERQLVVTGMGKSGHIARKVAATFSATGTPAIYIHPSEAGHGDLGMVSSGDVLLVFSASGNTAELRPILTFCRRRKIPIIGIAVRRNSFLIELSDIALLLPRVPEACAANIAPTTSTTMQLALGDALAMAVMDVRRITKNHLRTLHPAGSIGQALAEVCEIMHGPERLPLVDQHAGIPEVISVMTKGCLGLAGVTDNDGAVIGVITDGDLRRRFGVLTTAFAHEVMTPSPKVIPAAMPAGEALVFLNDNQITSAFVVEDPSVTPPVPIGIIHIHDLLRHGLN